MVSKMGSDARALHHIASQLSETLRSELGYARTKVALRTLLDALALDFDLAAEGYHAVQRAGQRRNAKIARLLTKVQLAKKKVLGHFTTANHVFLTCSGRFMLGIPKPIP